MATTTEEWIEVHSPYSGEVIGRAPKSGADDARRAVDAAARAIESPLPVHERAAILDRVAGLLRERHEDMARTICAEAGKPIRTARVEASRAASTFTFAAVEARRLAGDVVPMDASEAGEGKIAFTLRRPIGVIGAISPFNFPCNLVAHKLAPALAAGCPVVLKPASQTPLSALLLAELEHEAGLPAGWLNVVVGPSSEIGDALVADERVKLVTFTGSSEVGWSLRERAARKKVTLELGNATPVIVERDADVEEARTMGADVLTGGDAEGQIIRPTVIAGAPKDAKVSCDEVFGPVVTITQFDDFDEAVALANGTRFGLQAGIFTTDVRRALEAA